MKKTRFLRGFGHLKSILISLSFWFIFLSFLTKSHAQNAFITQWQTTTTDETITIPTIGGGYDYDVDWGDGGSDMDVIGNITHTYTTPGTYTVSITGDFPRIYFNNEGDKDKLISVNQWGSQIWTSMSRAFYGCSNMTVADTAGIPDLSIVIDMAYMFANCTTFNTDLNSWDPPEVINASHLFENCTSLDQPFDDWDMSKIEDMSYIFSGCTSLNSPTFGFGVGNQNSADFNQVNAAYALYNCTAYNQPAQWPGGNGSNFTSMFENCTAFNSSPPGLLLSRGGSAARMFKNASSFNQPVILIAISSSYPISVEEMFSGATAFDQDISSWSISGISQATGFMDSVNLSSTNYDALLNGWVTQDIDFTNLNISFGGCKFCTAEAARLTLMNTIGWNLTDNGLDFDCLPENEAFKTTWTTTTSDEEITIPTAGGGYYYYVDWGDGTASSDLIGSPTHTYTNPGTYTISIAGSFPRIFFNNGGDKDKLSTIEQWGTQVWSSMAGAFRGCSNMTLSANAGIPNLSIVKDMNYMFSGCSNFNTNINSWNPPELEFGIGLFENCTSLDQPFDNWELNDARDLSYVFSGCTSLNSPSFASGAGSGSVINASYAFFNCTSYNQPTEWPGSALEPNYTSMFENCTSFNSDPPNIVLQRGGSAARMFKNATSFNQPFFVFTPPGTSTDPSNLEELLSGATAFDQDISNWAIASVSNASGMLDGVTLSTANYDSLLVKWSGQAIAYNNVNISFGNSQYCTGINGKIILENSYGWNISDGGEDPSCPPQVMPFITVWTTSSANESITIPTIGSGYNYTVDWGDGTVPTIHTGDATHTYTNAGIHTVFITGDFPRIYFNNSGDKEKLITIFQWGDQVWTSMERAFYGCSNMTLSPTAGIPNLSNVTNMSYMFAGCSSFNTNINNWDVNTVIDCSHLFENCISLNQPFDNWELEFTKNVSYIFSGCTIFDSPTFDRVGYGLGGASINASYAFYNCIAYNQPTDWPEGIGSNYVSMFENCAAFNNTPPVFINLDNGPGSTARMFKNATSFNQPLDLYTDSDEEVSISEMFSGATSFDQDISSWTIQDVKTADGFMDGVTLSTANYDALLTSWGAQVIDHNNVTISFGNSQFCAGEAGRDSLINNFSWNITDGGYDFSCLPQNEIFKSTWTTTNPNETITIPTFPGETYDYAIDWGDGTNGQLNINGDVTHTYATPGTYTIQIFGTFPRIYFNNSGDKDKLTTIESWSNNAWTSMERAFYGCSNMTLSPTAGIPNLSNVSSLAYMFAGCSSFNTNINNWDVNNIINCSHLFEECISLNQPFDNWELEFTTNVSYIFSGCTVFNSPTFDRVGYGLGGAAINASYAFYNCIAYNQPADWPEGIGSNYASMFENCAAFNNTPPNFINLDNGPGSTARMFKNATSFNQPLDLYTDSDEEISISEMFSGATSFDQDISSWTIQDVKTADGFMDGVTLSTANYDALLTSWGSQVIDHDNVTISFGNSQYCIGEFWRSELINDYGWNITDGGKEPSCSSEAFVIRWQTSSANESITIPTIGNGYNYTVYWGDGNVDFNQTGDANHTYTSPGIHTVLIVDTFPRIYFAFTGDKDKIVEVAQWGNQQWTSMERAFAGCSNLAITATDNPDLSLVSDMGEMFANATSFNQDIGGWDVSNVGRMNSTFQGAAAFNQDLSGWDVSNVGDMIEMFRDATSFNQNLGDWDVGVGPNMNAMLSNSSLSVANYDSTLIGWGTLDPGETQIATNVPLGAGNLKYCTSETVRSELINTYNWNIFDSGPTISCNTNAFETEWVLTNANEMITITLDGALTYNFDIDWGDNSFDENVSANITHTYSTPGTYTIRIAGQFPRPIFTGETRITKVKQWGPIVWENMTDAFLNCTNLIVTAADAPDLTNVSSLENMFRNCPTPQFPASSLADWDVSNVTNMRGLFQYELATGGALVLDLSNWQTGNVTTMARMFSGHRGSQISVGMGAWDVSKVTVMASMFQNSAFLQDDITGWQTNSLTNMNNMFSNLNGGTMNFNQNISVWDVSNVVDMGSLFFNNASFNQDLSAWNVSAVTNLNSIFRSTNFDQDISDWNISSLVQANSMFLNSNLSTENYDNLLIGWSTLDVGETQVPTNVTFGAQGKFYCTPVAETGRQILINNGWQISDSGQDAECASTFYTTWQTTGSNETITIPTFAGETYNYNITWAELGNSANKGMAGPFTGDAVITLPTAGNYLIGISGAFPRIYFNNSGDKDKILSIEQWGNQVWTSMEWAFSGCTNLTLSDNAGQPDLSNVTNMQDMFSNCPTFNTSINHWDVSNVTNMRGVFFNSPNFNQDLDQWDVSNVTNMLGMFGRCTNFNGNISNWDVSNDTTMHLMFFEASSFNQDISAWDIAKVKNISRMFEKASVFNQNLATWDISSLTNASFALDSCGLSTENYDLSLIGWQTLENGESQIPSNITLGASNLTYCISAPNRNELINTYNWTFSEDELESNCTGMAFVTKWIIPDNNLNLTIKTSNNFNYNFTINWGDGNVLTGQTGDVTHAYSSSGSYLVSIEGDFPEAIFNDLRLTQIVQWGDIAWQDLDYAFDGCKNLVVDATDAPDLSNVTTLNGTFRDCPVSDFPVNSLSNWDVSTINSMSFLFAWSDGTSPGALDLDLSNWDVSNVTIMNNLFSRRDGTINAVIANWDVSNVTSMANMFLDAGFVDSDISSWNTGNVVSMSSMFRYRLSSSPSLNIDLSSWDVSKVEDMSLMFEGLEGFDQDLSNWNISSVTNMTSAFDKTSLSTQNYDNMLIAWSQLQLQPNVTLGAVNPVPSVIFFPITYCAYNERQSIIDTFNWTISDNGISNNCTNTFVTEWDVPTNNLTIAVNTSNTYNYKYNINWGDGEIDENLTGNASHTYDIAGTYTVSIVGTFPEANFDDLRLKKVLQWGDIAWQDLDYAFDGCKNLIVAATDAPDLSNVTTLNGTFRDCPVSDFPVNSLSNWDVSTINSMSFLFAWIDGTSPGALDLDLNNWDVSNVTIMNNLFSRRDGTINAGISNWDVSNVTSMANMFLDAGFVDSDISSWNTGNVVSMSSMFRYRLSSSPSLNIDLSSWDVSKVEDMSLMFEGLEGFDQDLSNWNISSVTNMTNAFDKTSLSTQNYDNMLIAWSQLQLQPNVTLGAFNPVPSVIFFPITYCAENERQSIIDNYGWTIIDNGVDVSCFTPFQTSWQTTTSNEQITIPTNNAEGYVYNYTIDWGDGNFSYNQTGDATHTYVTPGIHAIRIFGTFPSIYFNNSGDKDKILSIDQWGALSWNSMESAFFGCSNLSINAVDTPDLSLVTSMASMFQMATSMNQEIDHWEVGNVVDMSQLFKDASSFDQNLGEWDISSVTNLEEALMNTNLSVINYDSTLIGWSILDMGELQIPSGLNLGAQGLEYCTAFNERQELINTYGWTITDAGQRCCPTTTTFVSGAWDNGVPTSSVNAIIADNYDTATYGSIDACQVTVNVGQTLTINDNDYLNLKAQLKISGNVIVKPLGTITTSTF